MMVVEAKKLNRDLFERHRDLLYCEDSLDAKKQKRLYDVFYHLWGWRLKL